MLFRGILKIIRSGAKSLLYNYNGEMLKKSTIFIWLVLFPIIVAAAQIWADKCMNGSTLDTILTVLSIFTSLLFGVIFIAPEKLSSRLEKYKNDSGDAISNYLVRFRNFTNLFVNRLSFVITLCLILIVMLAMLLIIPSIYHTVILVINAVSVISFYYIIFTLFLLLVDIHSLLIDDINQAG